MRKLPKIWLVWLSLIVVALTFRLYVALRLPNDSPDDGRVYAQIARNVLEQHVYSHETEPPYVPSLIRLPGYPLFLAAIYGAFGHTNNTAVRIVQALIDTATCVLVALLAYLWMPDAKWKRVAATASLALAAVCPFTTIYVATILTEVPTSFLAVLACLSATVAFKSSKHSVALWIITGLVCGVAVLFRPDSGLFAAAIGLTMWVSALLVSRVDSETGGRGDTETRGHGNGETRGHGDAETWRRKVRRFHRVPVSPHLRVSVSGCLHRIRGSLLFAAAFCLVLVPWTIRNRRVFHLFQPLSPAHGEMPGEFVPRGYLLWLRTWVDDERYIGPVLWSLDTSPIDMDSFPDSAFDSDDERDRVEALIAKYDHADQPEEEDEVSEEDTADEQSTDEEQSVDEQQSASEADSEQNVEMTPEIDQQFAQLGRERISHSRLRYYLVLPFKRAISLWFDTHSQYYAFEGELFPLDDLDYTIHQHWWLPLFAGLTWVYTLLGAIGAWFLWRARTFEARQSVILALLIIVLRLGFFSTLENPEPRYVVELFPFLALLGGIAIGFTAKRISTDYTDSRQSAGGRKIIGQLSIDSYQLSIRKLSWSLEAFQAWK